MDFTKITHLVFETIVYIFSAFLGSILIFIMLGITAFVVDGINKLLKIKN